MHQIPMVCSLSCLGVRDVYGLLKEYLWLRRYSLLKEELQMFYIQVVPETCPKLSCQITG